MDAYQGSGSIPYLFLLAVLCLAAPQRAHAQEVGTPLVTNAIVEADAPAEVTVGAVSKARVRLPVEREIAVMGMIPAGDYRMFSATVRCNAWTLGVEYDRDGWGHILKSRIDYVAEVLPVVLLSEPAVADFWGNARSPNQQLLPGVSISPFGFRMLWRGNRAVKPYLMGKLGAAVFTRKALSPNATYANFNIQVEFGLQIKLTPRTELRVDPLMFFHVSNGYLAASNPGMDELATRVGVSYHLGKRGVE